MRVMLIIDLPGFKTMTEAQRFTAGLAEHIVEHYNEDNCIHRIITHIPSPTKGPLPS